MRVYTPIVYRFLMNKGLQDADAADVTQDVLIEVAQCIRRFEYKPEQGRFRDWLAIVTRRKMYRFWERGKSVTGLEAIVIEPAQAHDAEWIDIYQGELLRIALERVKQDVEATTWSAFSKTWIDNISAAEVAQELKLPIDLVYSAKSRVLKRLEVEIRMLGDDCGWIKDC